MSVYKIEGFMKMPLSDRLLEKFDEDALKDWRGQEKDSIKQKVLFKIVDSVLDYMESEDLRDQLRRKGRRALDDMIDNVTNSDDIFNSFEIIRPLFDQEALEEEYPRLHNELKRSEVKIGLELLPKMNNVSIDTEDIDQDGLKIVFDNIVSLVLLDQYIEQSEDIDEIGGLKDLKVDQIDQVLLDYYKDDTPKDLVISELTDSSLDDIEQNITIDQKEDQGDQEDVGQDEPDPKTKDQTKTEQQEDGDSSQQAGTVGETEISSDINLVKQGDKLITKGKLNATSNLKNAFENNLTDLKGDVMQKGIKQVVDNIKKIEQQKGVTLKIKSIKVQCTASTMANRGPAAKLTFAELAQKRGEVVKKLIEDSDELKPDDKYLAEDYEGVKVVLDEFDLQIRGQRWEPNGDGTIGPKTHYQEIGVPQADTSINYHLNKSLKVGTGNRPKSNFNAKAKKDPALKINKWRYNQQNREQVIQKAKSAGGFLLTDDEVGKSNLIKLVSEINQFSKKDGEMFSKEAQIVHSENNLKWFYQVIKALSSPMAEAYEEFITCYVVYEVSGQKQDTETEEPDPEQAKSYVCCYIKYIPPDEACGGVCDVKEFT